MSALEEVKSIAWMDGLGRCGPTGIERNAVCQIQSTAVTLYLGREKNKDLD